MKISLLGPTYPYRGGIAHYTTLLCRELRKGHEVQFLSFLRQYPKLLFPGKTDKDPSKKALKTKRVEYTLDSINPYTWLRTANQIVNFGPQLLVIPWWVVFWAPQFLTIATLVKKRTGAEVLFICHNAMEHEHSRWKNIVTKMVLSKGDRILTHSRQETEHLLELLGPEINIETAFHPTYAPLCGDIPESDKAKKQLGLKGNVLLFFGFVRHYKGLDILLRAMPEVLKEKDVTLLVVGEFWKDKDDYLKIIKDLDIGQHIVIIDRYIPNEEIGLYFAAADLVVQPYRSASGSGICQLAYGFGKPVIASNVGSLGEVIIDGESGRLVAPEDESALQEAIIRSLKEQELSKMILQAGLARDKFSWERLVRVVFNVY